jgi:hypothetical protein
MAQNRAYGRERDREDSRQYRQCVVRSLDWRVRVLTFIYGRPCCRRRHMRDAGPPIERNGRVDPLRPGPAVGTAASARRPVGAACPAAQCGFIEANHPGESARRMRTTHPTLTEGGVMAHATSAPSGSPHRGSRKFTATALCWLLASREHQGPAALTGQKADSKRGCAYRHRDHPPPTGSRKFTCCR